MRFSLYAVAVLTLTASFVRGANVDVQWDNGAGDNDWGNPLNWNGDVLPDTGLGTAGDKIHINLSGSGRAVYSSATGGNTYQCIRVGDSTNGELLVTGGALTSDSTTVTYIGSSNSRTGILTQTGGTLDFGGYMEVGLGANAIGLINLSGGTLDSSRNGTVGGVPSVSIALGDGSNAQGTLIMSGGLLLTRTGVLLGNNGGKGRFEVRGGGFASIGSDNSADDGFWVQSTNSVLAAYVANGSLGTIYIDKVAGNGGTYGNGNVIFMPGAKLELGFIGAPTNGSWTLMRWAGSVLTNGLSLSVGTDPNWSFTIDNTNGLRITYGSPAPAATNTVFVHPGVMHTLGDLERMRTNVLAANDPWYMGYTNMLADSHSSSGYAMQGPETTIVRDTSLPTEWENDCGAAYQNALLWYLTGDRTHAAKAIQILDAWANVCTNFSGSDARLTAGLQGSKYITAAELIRHTGAGWSPVEINTCSNFIRKVILPVNRMYGGGNWGQIGGISAMAAGVFLDDEAVFNEALNCIKYGAPTECDMGIANYINPGGWTTEADRDLGHWGLALDDLTEGAATAWCQGVDLWSFLNNRMLVAHEYLGRYMLTTNVSSYVAGVQCDGPANAGLTTTGLGTTWNPFWERAFHSYQNLLGLPAPWCSNVVSRIRPEGYDRDHVAFGTLVSALPTRAAGLPVVPSGLTATWTNAKVALTWNSASNAVNYFVKRAMSRGGPYTNIAIVAVTNYTDTTVANDALYFYKVSATNAVGETALSGLTTAYPSATVPAAPTGFSAKTTSHVRIDLSWNAVPGATSYTVKRATNNAGPFTVVTTGVGNLFPTYADIGLTPNTTYYYVVDAVNGIGTGADSAPANATTLPALPSSWNYADAGCQTTPGSATYTNGAFTVKGAGLDYGRIYTSDAFGFAYLSMAGDGTLVARLSARTNYSRLNKTGLTMRESLANGSKDVFLMFDGVGTNSMIYRSSTDAYGGGSGTNFGGTLPEWLKLERVGNTFSGSVSPDGSSWVPVGSVSITMSNTLLVGFAVCSRNNGWPDTAVFDNVSITGLWPALPGTPSALNATAGDTQAVLTWSAATNATGYNLKRGTSGNGPFAMVATNVGNLNFTNTGLLNGTLYYYVVSGTNYFGESTNSSAVSVRAVSLSPPQLGLSLNGNQLQFNWPADHIGWHLEVQTNSLVTGIGTNWSTVTGSDITNIVSQALNQMNGSVFYRLAYP